MVRREGIEPSTNWLKANCSTAELPAHFGKGAGMYSQAGSAQAGICPGADFLNQCIQAVFGPFHEERADFAALRPTEVTPGIITDVEALLRQARKRLKRSTEHARMRFGRSHLTGDDDLLKIAGKTVPVQDTTQTAVEIRENDETMIARKLLQCGHHIGKNLPGFRPGEVAVKIVKKGFQDVSRQGLGHHATKHVSNELQTPTTIIVSGWLSLGMQRSREHLPRMTERLHDLLGVRLQPMKSRKGGVRLTDRLRHTDERACGIKNQRLQWHEDTKKRSGCETAAPQVKNWVIWKP